MRDDRLEIGVTFDSASGYIASAPELRAPECRSGPLISRRRELNYLPCRCRQSTSQPCLRRLRASSWASMRRPPLRLILPPEWIGLFSNIAPSPIASCVGRDVHRLNL